MVRRDYADTPLLRTSLLRQRGVFLNRSAETHTDMVTCSVSVSEKLCGTQTKALVVYTVQVWREWRASAISECPVVRSEKRREMGEEAQQRRNGLGTVAFHRRFGIGEAGLGKCIQHARAEVPFWRFQLHVNHRQPGFHLVLAYSTSRFFIIESSSPIMPADRLLGTLLRSLQVYTDQQDTPR